MSHTIIDERSRLVRPAAQRLPEAQLLVTVLFTSMPATLAALRRAGELASQLGASIRVLDICVVPYPLPLEEPSVNCNYMSRRFQTLAGERPIPTNFEIRLCRDGGQALRDALPPHSLVVLGGCRRRWWPTREERLARALQRAGHEVALIDCHEEETNA